MRSNGWVEPRSRRRSSLLVLILVPVPVPVPVPGDAAGCRRQDMGDPSNDGIGDGGSESASRDCGGSVAAEADGRTGFVIRSVTHVVHVWHTIIEADPQYMRTFPSIFSTGNRASADSSSSIGIDGTYLWGFLAGIPKFHMSDDT
ncbi:hypothetical protein F4824DRAFT_497245 [Ustulina deusta]|nr:hypothetical protein F4824DRAFT_497245 [Ustulina deusta]